jgi:hypothetical protein
LLLFYKSLNSSGDSSSRLVSAFVRLGSGTFWEVRTQHNGSEDVMACHHASLEEAYVKPRNDYF